MQYEIIEETSVFDLELQVRAYIKDCWVPHGGPFICRENYKDWVCQAMVKK